MGKQDLGRELQTMSVTLGKNNGFLLPSLICSIYVFKQGKKAQEIALTERELGNKK